MRLHHLILAGLAFSGLALAGERIELKGYSVEAANPTWDLVMKRPRTEGVQLGYNTRPGDPLASAFIQVIAWREKEIVGDQRAALDYIKKAFDGQPTSNSARYRFTVMEMREVPIDRTICSRWHLMNEDRGVPGHQGEVFTTLIDSYTCPHPDDPSYLIEIMYSVRLPPGGQPFTRDADLDDMANSLKFTPLK